MSINKKVTQKQKQIIKNNKNNNKKNKQTPHKPLSSPSSPCSSTLLLLTLFLVCASA